MAISYNIRNEIEFGNFGTQPASPMVLLLTDNGLLVTFNAINLNAKKQSICYAANKMTFKETTPVGMSNLICKNDKINLGLQESCFILS